MVMFLIWKFAFGESDSGLVTYWNWLMDELIDCIVMIVGYVGYMWELIINHDNPLLILITLTGPTPLYLAVS
jgi:hypothetical protein